MYASCNFCVVESESFEEAIQEEAWKNEIEEEINVIEKNETWELVDRSKDKDVIGVKWIFKTKFNLSSSFLLGIKDIHRNPINLDMAMSHTTC